MARKMLEYLCDGDDRRWRQVHAAARRALEERIKLWDGIEDAIRKDQEANPK